MTTTNKVPNVPSDVVMRANGTVASLSPRNGKSYQLDELYSALNCELVEIAPLHPMIEKLPNYKGRFLICDEEGALRPDALLNERASAITGQHIFGDVALVASRRFR